MDVSLNSPSRSRERKKTSAGTIANSALSEVSSDRSNGASNERTLSTVFEGIFFSLWEFCMNLKIYLTPEHDPLENNGETQFNEEKKYTILISKEGKTPEVKAEEPDHVQPVSDLGNLIIGLSPKRGNGRYRLQVLSLNGFDNDGQLIGALRRVRKRCPFTLSTVTEIRVARMFIRGNGVFVVTFDDMPPRYRTDYKYLPRPPKMQPPIDPSCLARVFNSPNYKSLISTRRILDQLPKLQRRYNCHEHHNLTEAWGIVIIQRLDIRKVIIFMLFSHFFNAFFLYSMPIPPMHLAWIFVLPHNIYIIALTLYHGFMAAERFMISECLPFSDSMNEWIDACLRVIVPRVRWLYSSWRSFLTCILPWFGNECPYPLSATDSRPNNELSGSPVQERSDVTNEGAGTELLPIHASPSSRPTYGHPQTALGSAASNEDGSGGRRDHDPGPVPNGMSDPEAANLYLHLIISHGVSGKLQIPINVTNLQNDYQLARELNRAFRKHRGHWKALFSVRKLRPTKYILLNHAKYVRPDYNAANLASTMPDILNGLNEYVFSYRPPDVVPQLPLLHEEQLTCLYFNPESYVKDDIYDQQCFERAPKRKFRLEYTGEGYPEGYGFEFVESFDIKFVLTCELLLVAVAFIFAFVYFGVAHDPQKTSTAAQIAGLVFLIGQFMYGIMFALNERFEAWRFF